MKSVSGLRAGAALSIVACAGGGGGGDEPSGAARGASGSSGTPDGALPAADRASYPLR